MNAATARLVAFFGAVFLCWPCLAQYSLDSVVRGYARSVPRVRAYTGPHSSFEGSGTYLGNGWVLTARHVVEDGDRVTCVFGRQEVECVQRLVSASCDSALLKLQWSPNVPAVQLRNGALNRGETVFLSGYDHTGRYRWYDARIGHELTGSRGDRNIVCEANRYGESARWGNSGGPVLDSRARLIGNLHSSDHARSGGAETIAVHPRELCTFFMRAAQRYPDVQSLFASAPAYPSSQANLLSLQGSVPGASGGISVQDGCPGGVCPTPSAPSSVPTLPSQTFEQQLRLQLGNLSTPQVAPQATPCPPMPGEWVIPVPLQLRLRFTPQIGIGIGQ